MGSGSNMQHCPPCAQQSAAVVEAAAGPGTHLVSLFTVRCCADPKGSRRAEACTRQFGLSVLYCKGATHQVIWQWQQHTAAQT